MIETDADREAMMRALGGVAVSCQSGSFVGLLESDYINVVDVDSAAPRLTARSSDVVMHEVSQGMALRIEGVVYVVRSVQPDGTGMTTLVLEGP